MHSEWKCLYWLALLVDLKTRTYYIHLDKVVLREDLLTRSSIHPSICPSVWPIVTKRVHPCSQTLHMHLCEQNDQKHPDKLNRLSIRHALLPFSSPLSLFPPTCSYIFTLPLYSVSPVNLSQTKLMSLPLPLLLSFSLSQSLTSELVHPVLAAE